jgi:hypothetical protein
MQTGLMPEITVNESSDGVRFELASWQPARTRRATIFGLLGLSGICIGLMFATVGVMRWAAAQPLDPAANYFLMVMWAIGIAGLVSSIYALRGAPGRDWIDLDAHGIAVTCQVGPFRRSRRVVWGSVARLAVVPAGNVTHYEGAEGSFVLQAVRVRGGPVSLAGNDERVPLLALAGELARRGKAPRAASAEALMLPPPTVLEVVEEESRSVVAERDEQPALSSAILQHHADGVTITVPPLGLRGFLVQPVFLTNLVLIVALAAWIAVGAAPAVARVGFVGLFTFKGAIMPWMLEIFVLLATAHVFSRRAQLSARGGVLTVRSTNLLWSSCRGWPREELAEVRAVSEIGPTDVGQEWRQYLDIQPSGRHRSAPRRLLYWREKAELEWIATTLRRSLRLPATYGKPKTKQDVWDHEII